MICSRRRIVSLGLTLLLVLACWLTCNAEKKTVEVPLHDGDVLPGFCFFPDERVPNPWPGVVVAANAGGSKLAQYHTYCRRLADAGFAVLLVDASGYPSWLTPGTETWRKMPYHIWAWANHLSVVARLAAGHEWYVKNIDRAVDFLHKHPRVNPKQIAVSGFSQSANAALTYASGCSKIACVVWNNGGWPWILPYEPSKLPPILIFHGEADGVYNVRYARKLSEELRDERRDFECHIYPGERHMFNVYYDLEKEGDVDRPALKSSFNTLLAFLRRVLNSKIVSTAGRETVTAPIDEREPSNLAGLTRGRDPIRLGEPTQ
jgi:dienelactone hydrolase